MNNLSKIDDSDFTSFLRSLRIETFNKSYEWMLYDPEVSGILLWLYDSLDYNNALTEHEECRYKELEEKGQLLSEPELQFSLESIIKEYDIKCLPGDQEALAEVKLDISMREERLALLKKQEKVLHDLWNKNEFTYEKLLQEVTDLKLMEKECVEDEVKLAEEHLAVAEDLDSLFEGIVDVVADKMSSYEDTLTKETSKKFMTFGPHESYRQSQQMFKSHFDLFVAELLNTNRHISIDGELREHLVHARGLEDWLTNAVCAYIETKAKLSSEQAKLALVADYNHVHPSQIMQYTVEARSAIELLSQEELCVEQQLQVAVSQLVDSRTALALHSATALAVNTRENLVNDLTHLLDVCGRALCLDRALYDALRCELHGAVELLQFASQLRHYAAEQAEAISTRVESMKAILSEQENKLDQLRMSNPVEQLLYRIFNGDRSVSLAKLYSDERNVVKELNAQIIEEYRKKEISLLELKKLSEPAREFIYDGCTKQPGIRDRTTSSLLYNLTHEMESVDKKVVDLMNQFTSVKNGDKQSLRKLWQWFLTDHNALKSALSCHRK